MFMRNILTRAGMHAHAEYIVGVVGVHYPYSIVEVVDELQVY